MDKTELRAAIEAILLTASRPAMVPAIVEALEDPEVDATTVGSVLQQVAEDWERDDSGIRVEKVAGGWRCVTPPSVDGVLRAFHGIVASQRLSQAALEVLAITAHRQPVTLPEINFIRGANSASVVRALVERKLLRMAGRKKVVGKPFLYRTSKEFLLHFGLERPEDLPDPEELVKDDTTGID
jgi:segregation and condensation protein B